MNSKLPLVSIITPSYNSKLYIKDCIDSVLFQSYDNFEMIIVDDKSMDGSADLIKTILPDERFRLIALEQNIGAAEARNVAIKEAKGKYIAFLDSDDIWSENKLSCQVKFMQDNDIAFSFSSYNIIDQRGGAVGKVVLVPEQICFTGYMKNTIIGCLTVMIDRDKIREIAMPNLRSSHDMALWGQLLRDHGITAYGIQDVLASYRVVSTSNTANKWRAAKDVWSVYTKFFKFNTFVSFWFFVNYSINAILKRI